jgi:hypothetical protein
MRFRLNLPWSKILEWLKEIVGESISMGTLKKIFDELKNVLKNEYNEINENIRKSEIVGADETGIHLNGKKWWLHVYRTDKETLFTHSKRRNHEVPQSILGEDFSGILVSDFFGAYNKRFFPKAKGFQKCIGAHGLRKILYAIECEKGKSDYGVRLLNIVLDAIYLKKYFIFETEEYKKERKSIEERLTEILSEKKELLPESAKLKKLFTRYRYDLFPFLRYENLPPDNNGSERDIRDLVIVRKISGAYRSEEGLENLTVVKSVISTAIKCGEKFVEKIRDAFGDFKLEYG